MQIFMDKNISLILLQNRIWNRDLRDWKSWPTHKLGLETHINKPVPDSVNSSPLNIFLITNKVLFSYCDQLMLSDLKEGSFLPYPWINRLPIFLGWEFKFRYMNVFQICIIRVRENVSFVFSHLAKSIGMNKIYSIA